MFLFCLVFALFCARLFICALWSPAGKGLTSWLSFVVSSVSLSLYHWYPGSGVVLDCIDSWSLHHYLLFFKSLLCQGLSESEFNCDSVYKLKKIAGTNNFSAQFIQIISHYKTIGYNTNELQQTACLLVNPIQVGNFAFLFKCTPVGLTSDSMMVHTLK